MSEPLLSMKPVADANGCLHIGDQPGKEDQAVAAQSIGKAYLQQMHFCALDARVGGADGRSGGAAFR